MGVLDGIKKAGSVAGSAVSEGATRASKLSQAEVHKLKLRSLQDEVLTAQQEMGALVYDLVERGELSHPSLVGPQVKISEAQGRASDKEAEIAALKAEAKRGDEPTAETDAGDTQADSEA